MRGFYFDENVPGAIVEGLRQRGIDVLTAQEDGFDETPDPLVLDRAGELGRVLFTRDDDFLREAAARLRDDG
jgi:predicted nuclease of predicted toxin-antitoxin system